MKRKLIKNEQLTEVTKKAATSFSRYSQLNALQTSLPLAQNNFVWTLNSLLRELSGRLRGGTVQCHNLIKLKNVIIQREILDSCCSGIWSRVHLSVDAKFSEKLTLKMETVKSLSKVIQWR